MNALIKRYINQKKIGLAYEISTNYVDSLCNIYEFYEVEEIVHLRQLAVVTESRRSGIGTKVIMAVNELLKCLGIGPIVERVEGASIFSIHIFEKRGFSKLVEVRYDDYRVNGKIVFSNISGHESVGLYDIAI